MDSQLAEIDLAVSGLGHKADQHTTMLGDILHAFQAFAAGQSQIMGMLDMVTRQLVAINAALKQEPDGENLAELLRALLTQLGATTAELRLTVQKIADMPGDVANVLHSEGLTADQPEC